MARDVIDPFSGLSFVDKFNPDGSIGYSRQFDADGYYIGGDTHFFEVINGELYIAGRGTGPAYPVTNGSQYQGYSSLHYTHLDQYGNVKFASFIGVDGLVMAQLGAGNDLSNITISNPVATPQASPTYAVTDYGREIAIRQKILSIISCILNTYNL